MRGGGRGVTHDVSRYIAHWRRSGGGGSCPSRTWTEFVFFTPGLADEAAAAAELNGDLIGLGTR